MMEDMTAFQGVNTSKSSAAWKPGGAVAARTPSLNQGVLAR